MLVEGELAVYVERGGKTLLTFTEDADALASAMGALATSVRRGALGRLTVERADGVTRFTGIVLRPRVVIPAGSDRARALHVLEKSEKQCLVTASLSTPVRMEAEITEG